jgi:hypothetical protein
MELLKMQPTIHLEGKTRAYPALRSKCIVGCIFNRRTHKNKMWKYALYNIMTLKVLSCPNLMMYPKQYIIKTKVNKCTLYALQKISYRLPC